jgi:tRNA-Thr(GGU) m(6)t(6)A37 methyltransferase TsaA
MNQITLTPIGYVRSRRKNLGDDNWGSVSSEIRLVESFPEESLEGIETFSHAEVIFYFDQVADEREFPLSRRPRGNKDWPEVGIFAQRNKDRPNHIGLTVVSIVKRQGGSVFVKGLDAVDGTPVLDIKPVFVEFLPRETIHQPEWSHELMKNYWG